MGTVAIKVCKDTCVNAFQDKTYGKGKRVMNSNEKGDSFTCTACGGVLQSGLASKGKSNSKKK